MWSISKRRHSLSVTSCTTTGYKLLGLRRSGSGSGDRSVRRNATILCIGLAYENERLNIKLLHHVVNSLDRSINCSRKDIIHRIILTGFPNMMN
jgi:hypothetical protein